MKFETMSRFARRQKTTSAEIMAVFVQTRTESHLLCRREKYNSGPVRVRKRTKPSRLGDFLGPEKGPLPLGMAFLKFINGFAVMLL